MISQLGVARTIARVVGNVILVHDMYSTTSLVVFDIAICYTASVLGTRRKLVAAAWIYKSRKNAVRE